MKSPKSGEPECVFIFYMIWKKQRDCLSQMIFQDVNTIKEISNVLKTELKC